MVLSATTGSLLRDWQVFRLVEYGLGKFGVDLEGKAELALLMNTNYTAQQIGSQFRKLAISGNALK